MIKLLVRVYIGNRQVIWFVSSLYPLVNSIVLILVFWFACIATWVYHFIIVSMHHWILSLHPDGVSKEWLLKFYGTPTRKNKKYVNEPFDHFCTFAKSFYGPVAHAKEDGDGNDVKKDKPIVAANNKDEKQSNVGGTASARAQANRKANRGIGNFGR